MSKHLFGIIVTPQGIAANNRGETEGNITTLQKILWRGDVHTTISAEAIRFAIRRYWEMVGNQEINRRWVDLKGIHEWKDPNFQNWPQNIDDDVLGFMSATAAKTEGNPAENDEASANEGGEKPKKPKKPRGSCEKRRGRLEVTRALSLTPFAGDLTFNAASPGATPSASSTGKDPVPYGTELHATRYQFGFAITPEGLEKPERILNVIDALIHLSRVAGNHARFLYDFSPESIIFRWTDDFAPRFLYGFELDSSGCVVAPVVDSLVANGDFKSSEIIAGGPIAQNFGSKGKWGENCPESLPGSIQKAGERMKEIIARDLKLKG